MRVQRTHRIWPALAAAATLVAATAVAQAPEALAASGCRVDYLVASQWPGGFTAAVTVTNLGDALTNWRLTWAFSAGQTVTQAWNTSLAQSGSAVTADNVSYNGSLGTGASTQFGFNGSWSGSNPVPTSFALNGTTCTGTVGGDPSTTTSTATATSSTTTTSTSTSTTTSSTSSSTSSTTTTSTTSSSTTTTSTSSGNQPCDLYAAGGTPCVAAHSTTRALYRNYSGSLYQVRRASDGATRNIAPRTTGGAADGAAQDSFCSGTTCLITIIYDQSGRGNHLTQAPPGQFRGPASGGYDNLAFATAAPALVYGQKVYGVFVSPGTGYRDNSTNGVATGDQPEGMYAIFDGTHYNDGCCFDYGNAETNSWNNGNGTMEAIYFGDSTYWGRGAGNGPWIMADLENGLFSGVNVGYNGNTPSLSHRFLTAILKGGSNHWATRGGNAQSGGLTTFYDGRRPNASGYHPMKKEGAIILGTGGDNSIGAQGTFYEGAMTAGYPSNATEDAVQATIVAAGYSAVSRPNVGMPSAGSSVSLRATTSCCTTRYVSHSGATVTTQVVTSSSSSTEKANATWVVRRGLADSSCVSFEARNASGSYLRHYDFQVTLAANNGSRQFAEDATFCPQAGMSGQGLSFPSRNYPANFLRHYANNLYVAANGGPKTFEAASLWADDVSWVVSSPWA